MLTAAARRELEREQARQIAELAEVIRDNFPEIGPETAQELAQRAARAFEAARPDGVAALLAELAALGIRP